MTIDVVNDDNGCTMRCGDGMIGLAEQLFSDERKQIIPYRDGCVCIFVLIILHAIRNARVTNIV